MMELDFTDVGLRFGGHVLWQHLTAHVVGGRITAVVGANGAGKSTLLRLAARRLRPTQGRIMLRRDGRELAAAAYSRLWGLVSPELACYPELTAHENMHFLLGLRGIELSFGEIDDILARVGLPQSAAAGKYVGSFSTGMRQRLKLALLLASKSAVWLLDEPGANLDAAGREMVLRLARAAAEDGRLVLLATNDEREVQAADEVIDLDRF